jgi:hypothetical protein
MKKLFVPLLIAVALAGCGENTPVQTVGWYRQHDAERNEMIAKCKSSPGGFAASPNCVNSQQADNEKANARRGWLTPGTSNTPKKGD